MKISFQKQKIDTLPELLFCWRLQITTDFPSSITDIFIPELFFDFFWLQEGEICYRDAKQQQDITSPRQSLKTLHTHRLDLVLKAPLALYGARFSLPFAELFWQKEMPTNTFLEQDWISEPIRELNDFARQITHAIQTRRVKKTISPMLHPTLAETDWLAAYSPRHKRRLYKSVFGLSKKEIQAIQNIHLFLGQTCDFGAQMPRIIEYVNDNSFYDQPHLNNAFKKMTGLAPLAYFEANSILQDNLMAASYNELPSKDDRMWI
ncbi:hypothetical protein [Candidatus Leptofilum sp.]|uniref:hypothetical protein n=1 Tax=Candidatus Leptofilum sp. TaxID=3241576 RepID=UPI003B597CAD